MKQFPILYWPRRTTGDAEYHLARKVISGAAGTMPTVVTDDLDLAGIFEQNPNATVYYPVFCESTGWWGELLGGDAVVTDKLIISPECQLMVIESGAHCDGCGHAGDRCGNDTGAVFRQEPVTVHKHFGINRQFLSGLCRAVLNR